MTKSFKELSSENVDDDETCFDLSKNSKFFECSKCSFTIMKFVTDEKCPLCGRKIIKEKK